MVAKGQIPLTSMPVTPGQGQRPNCPRKRGSKNGQKSASKAVRSPVRFPREAQEGLVFALRGDRVCPRQVDPDSPKVLCPAGQRSIRSGLVSVCLEASADHGDCFTNVFGRSIIVRNGYVLEFAEDNSPLLARVPFAFDCP